MPDSAAALHLPTLLFVASLIIAFTGCLLLAAEGPKDDTRSLRYWGGALFLGAMGLVAAAAGRGTPWISPGLSNLIFLMATIVSWTAMRMFVGKPARAGVAILAPLLWLAALPLLPGPPWWIGLACAIGVVFLGLTVRECWRADLPHLPSRSPALVMLSLHGVIYAMRGIFAVTGMSTGPWAATILCGFLLESMLYTVGIAFLALALVKEASEHRSSEKLRALTLQDPLTGIGNRRHFDERLVAEVARARRHRWPLALLLIDVDHFKAFNDLHGHPEGDECLRLIARTIAASVRRPGDLAARYGGEEFAVLMPSTTLEGAMEVAHAVRSAVNAKPHDTCFAVVTISVGVASGVPPATDPRGEALLRMADRALYEAKRAGRDRVHAEPKVAAVA